MFVRTRILSASLALGLLLLGGRCWQDHQGFAPFVPTLPSHRAVGDFDGDGRLDLALVQDGTDGPSISVKLSGSTTGERFDENVTSLVEADIDHDGDLDLIATTPSREVLIWINDGHGRFTRQTAAPRERNLSGAIVFVTGLNEPVVMGVMALPVAPRSRTRTGVVVTRIRPPTVRRVPDLRLGLLPPLRAPPAFKT